VDIKHTKNNYMRIAIFNN